MPKYEVTIYVEGSWTIKIEAEDEDAAKKMAEEKCNFDDIDLEVSDIEAEELDTEELDTEED